MLTSLNVAGNGNIFGKSQATLGRLLVMGPGGHAGHRGWRDKAGKRMDGEGHKGKEKKLASWCHMVGVRADFSQRFCSSLVQIANLT